jgi:hypothetical protein
MRTMSERPDGVDEGGLWVVEVTAPLASGRVREVAADAAARLKLPIEKLVALLENRIGPVTKPLPRASASRVAEVLDLSGAEVALRPAEVQGEAAPPPEPAPAAVPPGPDGTAPESDATEPVPDATEPVPDATEPVHDAVDATEAPATSPEPTSPEPRSPEPTPPAPVSAHEETMAAAADAPATGDAREAAPPTRADAPDEDVPSSGGTAGPAAPGAPAVLGRAGRGVEGVEGGAVPQRPAARDAWATLDDERPDEDEAMLGRWTTLTGFEGRSATPPPTAERESRPVPPPEPSIRPPPIAIRPPVAEEDDDEEEASWAYGLRDPFADAEARERRLRRWTLMIALLVASTIFVALQWAYSRPGPGDASPPPFAEGLAAYRDGAFVSAARLWTPRAEAGDAEAMFLLGWMAEYGQGRPWSNREAASWYRQAAERGHPRAQLRLADLHRAGLGVAFDEEAALRWYRAAAEGGVARAQRELALALARQGRVDEARAWLARAAAGDDPVAAAWWSLEADGPATTVSP